MTPAGVVITLGILAGSFAVGWVAGGLWPARRVRRAWESRTALERHLRSMSRVTR